MRLRCILTVLPLCLGAAFFRPLEAQPNPTQTTSADSLHIQQVIAEVIANNDRFAAAKYMEQASRDKVGMAGAWDDPMFMVGVVNLPTSFDFKMDPMTMKMLGISQTIPLAGQKGLQRKAAEFDAEASGQDARNVQIDLATTARIAYADLYFSQKITNELAAQYELLDQIVDATRAKVASNQAGQEEYLAAQAELWRMQAQLLMQDHDVDRARWDLNALRGRPVDDPIPPLVAPEIARPPDSADLWLAQARQNYPPLKRLSLQSQSYDFSSQAANRMRWPMLNLQANYGIRASTEMEKRDNMIGFQAGFTLPLFSGRQQKGMALSMRAMQRSTDAEAVQLSREIEARLRALHLTALHLYGNLSLYRDRIVPADKDAFDGALAGYAANRTQFTSLLNYAGAVFRDRVAAAQIAQQFAQTQAEIERYISAPLPEEAQSKKEPK
jgi:outer membrane protein TolC